MKRMTRKMAVQLAEEFSLKHKFDGSCGVSKEKKHGKYCIRVVLSPVSNNAELPSHYKNRKVVLIKAHGEMRPL